MERRAYKQAVFAVRDEHAALDPVQDTMLKLSEKYGDRPAAELPLLFQRILQNTIRDFYRRQKVRALWTTPVSALFGTDTDEEYDPLETLEVASESMSMETPSDQLARSQVLQRPRAVWRGQGHGRAAARRGAVHAEGCQWVPGAVPCSSQIPADICVSRHP